MKGKTWMNVLFLIWWYMYVTKLDQHTNVCAQSLDLDKVSRITQIKSQTGVYFDWSLVTYVVPMYVLNHWTLT
jgi:hypothetical protein